MSEIDTDRLRDTADLDARAGAPVGNALRAAADEIDRIRARLAEVEAELMHDSEHWAMVEVENERMGLALAEARRRLAAVLALCEQQPLETPCSCDPAYTDRDLIAPDCAWHQDIESFVGDVRAAAGEDAR